MKTKNEDDFSAIQSQIEKIETALRHLNEQRPPKWVWMIHSAEITKWVNELRIQVDEYAKTRDSNDKCKYCRKNDFDCKRSSVFNRSLNDWVCEKKI